MSFVNNIAIVDFFVSVKCCLIFLRSRLLVRLELRKGYNHLVALLRVVS